MDFDRLPPRRPAVLTLIGLISLFWSLASVFGYSMVLLGVLGLSALSWLGGPVAGAVGTFVAFFLFLYVGTSSIFSLILLMAAWKTLRDRPSGRSYHRTWAWVTAVLDLFALIFTGGLDPAAWWGMIYAVCILYVTNQPDIRAYYGLDPAPAPLSKPPGVLDDGF